MNEFVKQLLPHQDDFVFSEEKYPLLQGGLGSGKSEAGVLRIMRLMFENNDANFIYAMPTYDLLRLRAIPAFEEFLEASQMSYKLNKSEAIISVDGYGDIIFRSYDNPKRIVAFEVFAGIVDELDTLRIDEAEYVWRKIMERVRQKVKSGAKNSLGAVTTPDMGFAGFIYKKWHKMQQPGYEVIKASTYDNPFLPKEYIQNILDNYDPILADLYLRGEIVSLNQNKVYHFFDRKRHHRDRVLTKEDKNIYVTIDFNVGGCCSNVYVIDKGYPVAVDEFVSRDTYDFVNNLIQFKEHNVTVYPDASGRANKTNASRTDIQIIEDAGYNIDAPKANPPIRDRVNSFNALLAHDRFGVNTDKCPNLTNALEIQGYDDKGDPEKWNTHPAVDDWVDGSGYFINRRWGLTKPKIGVDNFVMR